ncbi:hypothetical protein KKH15_02300 [Patescibacteria group bacterium]|nr:hypothetical protein [Patescibacteria group bacterium]MBU1754806.1 hypothetical protein [Patescibacteria group bacterium]
MVLLHVFLIIITGVTVLYSDEQGLEWFVGKQKTLKKKAVEMLHIVVSLGLSGIILTGGLMLIQAPGYLQDPTFITKMVFVGALVINGLLIGSLTELATTQTFAELKHSHKVRLLLSGAVSVIGWIGAISCGILL